MDRVFILGECHLTFEGIDCTPGLNDSIRVPLSHSRYKFIGAGRSARRCFEIQCNQDSLDTCIAEVFDHVTFDLRCPRPIPILGQRINVWLLTCDPFLGIGITVNVDDSHAMVNASGDDYGLPARLFASVFSAIISTSFFFDTLPNVDKGNSRMISRLSGSLYLAISLPNRNCFSSSKLNSAPSRTSTQAHIRSPRS